MEGRRASLANQRTELARPSILKMNKCSANVWRNINSNNNTAEARYIERVEGT